MSHAEITYPGRYVWFTEQGMLMDKRDKEQRLINELSNAIEHIIYEEEDQPTLVEGLKVFRRESPSEACPCLYEPGIVVVAQGAKQMLIDRHSHVYDQQQFLVNALDLPASTQVLSASHDRPCLGLSLRLDRSIITELIAHIGVPRDGLKAGTSVATGNLSNVLLEPLLRLLALTQEPSSIPHLAPLIIKEIHYRLLMSGVAPCLWQLASVGSASHRIGEAIGWLKLHYAERISVEQLATAVQMSASSLHHRFRQLTGISPLQYQKRLRINAARRLMINEHLDAATASYRVGYESPSQFSREYKHLFGAPPKQHLEGVRRPIT
ncbi:AraC family transcriptional regulator [Carnimonas bestiolae]|uniref:AraC family transcriptional regulator n=1 Tax=Carnimonas bestiolae TaxID=3402172 RepID=UPI003F4A90B5